MVFLRLLRARTNANPLALHRRKVQPNQLQTTQPNQLIWKVNLQTFCSHSPHAVHCKNRPDYGAAIATNCIRFLFSATSPFRIPCARPVCFRIKIELKTSSITHTHTNKQLSHLFLVHPSRVVFELVFFSQRSFVALAAAFFGYIASPISAGFVD